MSKFTQVPRPETGDADCLVSATTVSWGHMTVPAILNPISRELQCVQDEVERQLSEISAAALSQFQTITDNSVHHLFTAHGKYLRPSLVLLTARAFGDRYTADIEHLVKIAAAVELIHSASLVHDDIIDMADERRGQPSLNSVLGNKMAVLVGDLLYDQAFALLTELTGLGPDAQLALFELVTSTTRKMCLGEIYEDQIVAEPSTVTFDDYLQVIDHKTASLMACCCRASAIAVGADDRDSALVDQYGHHLGRTYQLIDDVIDEDSVFFNREEMLNRAVEEGLLGNRVLGELGENDGIRRLFEITQTVIKKAGQTIRV
ncbi:MAG: polyprenyl synthetase family protein [Spirochaetaceae bacterium]|nr:polyprenyl synthetase family protein [Spirochaetaceae bacterium]